MWQRFTEDARKIVFYAQEEAGRLGGNHVDTEHFLLAITRIPGNEAATILARLGVELAAVRSAVEALALRGDGRTGQDMQLTPRAKRVVDLAYEEAKRFKHKSIGAEHLLLGILHENEGSAGQALAKLGVTLEAARLQLLQLQDKQSEELLSLDEAVKFLGTSRPTLYRLLGQDEIKGLKVGRQWRFRKADLVAYMERGPVAVNARAG